VNQNACQKLFASLALAGIEYASLHRTITAFFGANGCGPDSEGLADVTLLDRLARKVDEGKEVRNFVFYSREIAKLVYKEYLKEREKFRRAARDLLYLSPDAQNFEEDTDLRRKCQESCIASLPETDRQLMIDYYVTGKDRGVLAEELGLLIATLRTHIHRLRRRLKKCVDDCRKKA
jgi:DNA-directed RNA polymerase specialized sigma24 family protein